MSAKAHQVMWAIKSSGGWMTNVTCRRTDSMNAPNWIQKAADDAAAVASEFGVRREASWSLVTGHWSLIL